jgi:HK97 gp10 family phage protein
MSDDVTVKITGLAELQEALEQLPEKVARKGVRSSLQAGAAPVLSGMVQEAPKRTGFLSEHFDAKISLTHDALAGTAYVGPEGKMDYPEYLSGAYRVVRKANGKIKKIGRIAVAAVARYSEFGTVKMEMNPFMTRAWEQNKEAALDALIKNLKDTLEQAVTEAPKGKLTK